MSDANFINTLWGQWAVVYFAFILLGISLLLLDPHLHLGSSPSYVVFQLTLSLALRVTWMLERSVMNDLHATLCNMLFYILLLI